MRWSNTSDMKMPGTANTGVAAGYYIIIISTIHIAVNALMISLLIDYTFKISSQFILQDMRTYGRVRKAKMRLPLQSSTALLKNNLPCSQISRLANRPIDLAADR